MIPPHFISFVLRILAIHVACGRKKAFYDRNFNLCLLLLERPDGFQCVLYVGDGSLLHIGKLLSLAQRRISLILLLTLGDLSAINWSFLAQRNLAEDVSVTSGRQVSF